MGRKRQSEVGLQKDPPQIKGVVAVKVDSRELFTVLPAHPIWGHQKFALGPKSVLDRHQGAIIRLDPPDGVEDAVIEKVRAALLEAGVAKVTVLPRRKKDVVPDKAMRKANPAASIRQVVSELVEASSSADKDALKQIVEATMSSAGL